jgi:hypothetical protein
MTKVKDNLEKGLEMNLIKINKIEKIGKLGSIGNNDIESLSSQLSEDISPPY